MLLEKPLNSFKTLYENRLYEKLMQMSCGPVAEGFRRRTLASSLEPPQKSHHVDDTGSSPVRAEHSQATPLQKVHIG